LALPLPLSLSRLRLRGLILREPRSDHRMILDEPDHLLELCLLHGQLLFEESDPGIALGDGLREGLEFFLSSSAVFLGGFAID
jgi:hypothetical protein